MRLGDTTKHYVIPAALKNDEVIGFDSRDEQTLPDSTPIGSKQWNCIQPKDIIGALRNAAAADNQISVHDEGNWASVPGTRTSTTFGTALPNSPRRPPSVSIGGAYEKNICFVHLYFLQMVYQVSHRAQA